MNYVVDEIMRSPDKRIRAFTLIEMMVVVAIIAILALIAMPNNYSRTAKLQVVETLDLVEIYKGNIERTYALTGGFPANNKAAGMPESHEIKGNYLAGLKVENGILNLEFGQKMNEQHHGKILSIRPVYVESDTPTPISWICGADPVPDGMRAADKDKTTLEPKFLPLRCL